MLEDGHRRDRHSAAPPFRHSAAPPSPISGRFNRDGDGNVSKMTVLPTATCDQRALCTQQAEGAGCGGSEHWEEGMH